MVGKFFGARLATACITTTALVLWAAPTYATAAKPPGKPTAPSVVIRNNAFVVSWSAPTSDGGALIDGYTVTATAKNLPTQTCTTDGNTSTCLLTGIVKPARYAKNLYSIKITAHTSAGTGAPIVLTKIADVTTPDCSYIGPYATLHGCTLSSTNLSTLDLTGADLSGSDLRGADLFRASLTGANLAGANLTGTILADADLTSTDFTNANLQNAVLTATKLGSAKLTGANLTTANLTSADISGATFTNATFTGVMASQVTGVPAALPTNWVLVLGYLAGPTANMVGAQLVGANLTAANLTSVNFGHANLSYANLYGANLNSAGFSYANLSYANLHNTNTTNADFFYADTTGAVCPNGQAHGSGGNC